MKIKNLLPLIAIWAFIIIPFQMNAHKPDQTYLYLRVYQERIEGSVEITVGDLNDALGLGLDTEAYKGACGFEVTAVWRTPNAPDRPYNFEA